MANEIQDNRFLYIESNQIPLKEIPFDQIKEHIIDPTTGKPYKGIILEGIFAVLKEELNNNKRIYDIPKYLELVKILHKQIFSPKGVYGELEHPKTYSVDYRNVSHKILDIWYDEKTLCVMGRVMLLNTPNGLIAQEIIRSGGQLAISARAAGKEIKNPDGTFSAITELLTTYDLVYHPGFAAAVLEFRNLNESQKMMQEFSEQKAGFSAKIYEKDLKKIDLLYGEYISLNESQNCFYEWYTKNSANLLESVQQKSNEKKDQEILEKNQTNDQKHIQKKLQKASDEDLSEDQKKQQIFFQEASFAQKKLKHSHSQLGNSFYDNSNGFIDSSTLTEDDKDDIDV